MRKYWNSDIPLQFVPTLLCSWIDFTLRGYLHRKIMCGIINWENGRRKSQEGALVRRPNLKWVFSAALSMHRVIGALGSPMCHRGQRLLASSVLNWFPSSLWRPGCEGKSLQGWWILTLKLRGKQSHLFSNYQNYSFSTCSDWIISSLCNTVHIILWNIVTLKYLLCNWVESMVWWSPVAEEPLTGWITSDGCSFVNVGAWRKSITFSSSLLFVASSPSGTMNTFL